MDDVRQARELIRYDRYFMGRTTELTLLEAELVLTSALIGLGAARQAGSHIKACIAFGYSEADVQAVATMAEKLAKWLDVRIQGVNVAELARQAKSNLCSRK